MNRNDISRLCWYISRLGHDISRLQATEPDYRTEQPNPLPRSLGERIGFPLRGFRNQNRSPACGAVPLTPCRVDRTRCTLQPIAQQHRPTSTNTRTPTRQNHPRPAFRVLCGRLASVQRAGRLMNPKPDRMR